MSRFHIDWDAKDDRLRKLFAAGEPQPRIAEILGVTRGAVSNRINKLGLTR